MRNPEPKYPKPLYLMREFPATKEDIIDHTQYSINFYRKRLILLNNNKPLLFQKKWKEEKKEILKKISNLEYKLLELTEPDIIKEVEECLN